MKTTEQKMVWKLVKAGEDRPLTAADLALLLRLRFALQEYEADTGQERGKGKRVLQVNAGGGGDGDGGKADKTSSGAAFERQARAPVRSSEI